MNNIYKHKILKELIKVSDNNPELDDTKILAQISRSLSFKYLSEKIRISTKNLDENLKFLALNNEIIIFDKNSDYSSNYKITENGKKAYYQKFYKKDIWYYKLSNWISIISLLIALIGIWINFSKPRGESEEILKLAKKIEVLEIKLKK